jgi:uncharacterized iron-regulated membrane protein
MFASRLKLIAVLIAAVIVLVVGSSFITWKIAQMKRVARAVTVAQRDYPSITFSESQLTSSLKTESESDKDSVRFQLRVIPASEDSRKTFALVMSSPLSRALGFTFSLDDAAGFTLCKYEVDRKEMVVHLDDAGNGFELTANGEIDYCPSEIYARVTQWSIASRYNAIADAVRHPKTAK